mgnify:CR=1 FL=1
MSVTFILNSMIDLNLREKVDIDLLCCFARKMKDARKQRRPEQESRNQSIQECLNVKYVLHVKKGRDTNTG